MIKIHASSYKLLIQGHEISETANQLLCCAVSAISLTGINCFKKTDVNFKTSKGYLKVILLNRNNSNRIKWRMLINQLYFIYLDAKKQGKGTQISWN